MKSIQTKIVALLLCSVLLSSMGIGLVCIFQTSDILHESAQENMMLLCDTNADKLDTLFERIEVSVDTLAHFAISKLTDVKNLQDPDYRKSYINEVLPIGINHANSSEGALAVYAVLDPSLTEEAFGFYLRRDNKHEELMPVNVTNVNAYPDSDLEHVGWWYLPKKAAKSLWIDSYHNTNKAVRMISHVTPLYYDGQFFGVVGMDISCNLIEEVASSISVYETGFATVLNSDKTVLYHPTVSAGETIGSDNPDYAPLKELLEKSQKNTQLFPYTYNNKASNLAFRTLRNDMILLITAPDAEIYARQNTMLLISLITMLVIFTGCTVLALWFANRLTTPLKKLNAAAYEMTQGNLDVEITSTTKDEIGELAVSFNRARESLKLHINTLYDEAHHDGLTGIGNKNALAEIEAAIDKKIADGTARFVVALFDVNRLKVTNDIFGHMAGDEMLRTVSGALKEDFDQQNVFRVGGDEFVVLLQDENAEGGAERILACAANMKNLTLKTHPDITISCAVGVAVFDPQKDTAFAGVFDRADMLMYKNKSKSKKSAPAWHKNSKGIKQIQIEKNLEFLQILSQSTEDYLFLIDIANDKNWFLGDVNKKFPLYAEGDRTCSTAELMNIVHPSDRKALLEDLQRVFDGESEDHNLDYRWINRNGVPVWVNCRGRVIKDNGHPFLMIGRVSDNLLRPLYNTMTGLFNKTKLMHDFRAKSTPPFRHFMLIDVDNFSGITLTSGHKYADELLCLLAEVLEGMFPLNRIYHMEKDRFVVLLDEATPEQLTAHIHSIQEAIGGSFTVSAAIVPNDKALYVDEESFYEYAQSLLAERKNTQMIVFFSKEDFLKRISGIELLEELEHSVHNNFEGFYLCYQPQVDATNFAVVGAEALLRYRSPKRGQVFPDELIPLLERTKLINAVGLWVCETAFRQCVAWRGVHPDFRISVNFSTIQLRQKNLSDEVIDLLDTTGLPGSAVTLELTESIQVEDTELIAKVFEKFRKVGIRIAIDDFGTGYANLGYLRQLHADKLKIDRLFIKDIKENSYNYTIITNILEIARANSFFVCLEGVETVDELAVLQGVGADTLQGYLFGKPIEASEFERLYIEGAGTQWSFLQELGKRRKDVQFVHFDTKDLLEKSDIGLWVIRADEKHGRYELFADLKMRELLGIDDTMTPEECYRYWYERIKKGYAAAVDRMVLDMAKDNTVVKVLYPWNHPTRGEVMVRCTGKCIKRSDSVIVFEGFHRLISDMQQIYTDLTQS